MMEYRFINYQNKIKMEKILEEIKKIIKEECCQDEDLVVYLLTSMIFQLINDELITKKLILNLIEKYLRKQYTENIFITEIKIKYEKIEEEEEIIYEENEMD